MWSWIVNSIFPDTCQGCNSDGRLFCHNCLLTIAPLSKQQCFVCFGKQERGKLCSKCQPLTESYLDYLLVGASYKDNRILALLIKTLKYKTLKRSLSYLPVTIFHPLQELLTRDNDVIFVPVPLHRKRQKERGFNQSEIIARYIQKNVGGSVHTTLLRRTKYTEPQAKKTKEEREVNLTGAFRVHTSTGVDSNSVIVLIDDVSSTRTTLERCAMTLRDAGFTNVGAFVLARN